MWLLSNRVRFYNKWTRVIVWKLETIEKVNCTSIQSLSIVQFIYYTYTVIYIWRWWFSNGNEKRQEVKEEIHNTLWINYKVFHGRKIHIISFYPEWRSSINVSMHVGPIQGTWKMIHNAHPFSLFLSLEQPFNGNSSSSSSWIMRNYKLIFI